MIIKNIKKILTVAYIIISLNFNLFATNWYVDGTLTGTDNGGTSWADAWESFAEINWASIGEGDTLFISGGSDSTIYYETLEIYQVQGTVANPITIIAGKYAPNPTGHSGRVIIDGSNKTRLRGVWIVGTSGTPASYIILKGIESRGSRTPIHIEDYCNVITVDSCYSYDFYDLAGVFVNGQVGGTTQGIDSVIIKNCTIITSISDPEVGVDNQTDGIYFSGVTNTLIYGNYIDIRIQDPQAHVDGIQSLNTSGNIIIYNNIVISDSVDNNGGGMPFIVRAWGTQPVIVYNNFMYMGGIWYEISNNTIVLNTHSGDQGQGYGNPPPTYILHNTIIGNGPQVIGASLDYFNIDSKGLFINNIVALYGDGIGYWGWLYPMNNSTGTAIDVDSVRSNLFYQAWNGTLFKGDWTNGSITDNTFGWTYWTETLGGGGINSDPLLVNNIGNEPDQGVLRGYLQSGSPAINAGEDAEWYIDWLNSTYNLTGEWALTWTDIDGNIRDDTPTIGAYEYAAATDSNPSFTFTDLTNVELNSYHTTYAVFSNADTTFWVTAGSDSFKIGALGTFDVGGDTAHTGDTVYIAKTASGSYATAVSVTVTAGGNNDTWTVTTKNQPVANVPKNKILIRK